MSNTSNMIESLNNLKKAFSDVNKAWDQCYKMDNLRKANYPFEYSFDELNIKVHNWIEEAINELQE